MTEITDLKWRRIIAGGVGTHAVSIGLLVFATITYTLFLIFLAEGEPSEDALQQFNVLIGTQIFPLMTILLTAAAAGWVARRSNEETALVDGFAVGLIVAIIGLGFGALDFEMGIRFLATVIAGVIGARLSPVLFTE